MPTNRAPRTPSTASPRRLQCLRGIALVAMGWIAALTAPVALAQSAQQPIRILVGFPPGGGLDASARILAEGLSTALDQPVIVENRPGAGGLIAAQALKAAAPDGKTLLLTNDHTVAILPHTLKNPGFSPPRDFTAVALVTDKGFIALATHASTQITQVKDVAEWARKHPGQVNMGVPAPGSIPEFAVGLLAKSLHVETTPVPYRGGAPLLADLVGGQIPFGITSSVELAPYAKSKKVRLLAVSGTSRLAEFPDVPTFGEAGIAGLESSNLVGIYAPAGTAPSLIGRYSEAVRATLASDKTKARLEGQGVPINYGGPDALAQSVQRISDSWGAVIRQSGYQPQ